LSNGTSYIFRVAAINGSGTGPYSDPSVHLTPSTGGSGGGGGANSVGVPGAPSGVNGTAGNGKVVVSWVPPADDGGSPITSYTVQYSKNDGATWSAPSTNTRLDSRDRTASVDPAPPATTKTVTGLTNGTAYVFRVAAANDQGTGQFSPPSGAVTPRGDRTGLTIGGSHPVRDGHTVKLKTVLTDLATTTTVRGATVTLLARRNGMSAWHAVTSATTNVHGAARVHETPHHGVKYRWAFAGDDLLSASTSPVERVTVVHRHVR
jgi:hypothetical protein